LRVQAIALIAATAVSLAACGDKKTDTTPSAAATTPAPSVSTSPSTSGSASTVSSADGIKVSTDLSKKPTITKPTGPAPTTLVTRDIVVGKGQGATVGDELVAHYLGAHYTTGKQFQASWDTGRPFAFTLGQGGVIPGWVKGLEGMKIGGRRLLIIPPALAYGDQGQGDIKPGETLIFVVDLLNDTPA
jgi:peptidylprolyl isomerase